MAHRDKILGALGKREAPASGHFVSKPEQKPLYIPREENGQNRIGKYNKLSEIIWAICFMPLAHSHFRATSFSKKLNWLIENGGLRPSVFPLG